MAITVSKPTGLNPTSMPSGRYKFIDSGGNWEYIVVGKWGKCKAMAIAAYKRDKGSKFGSMSSELIKE